VARGYGQGNRGIDSQLETGDRVAAAAAGEVVYAGSGLGGFRHLVIVKHDPEYLSAYGFDGTLGVREGQRIKAGALLADKEDGGRRAGTLHFEIRRDGVPVDPGPLIAPAR
jgi:lipoprotein NlpD